MARVEKLAFDVARRTVEAAFTPLECTTHVCAASDRVDFRVCDATGATVFVSERLNAHHLCNSAYLSRVLVAARLQVERLGFALDSWHLPLGSRRSAPNA